MANIPRAETAAPNDQSDASLLSADQLSIPCDDVVSFALANLKNFPKATPVSSIMLEAVNFVACC